MRKLWLTFTAMLLCSIASFAQFGGGTGSQTDPYLISDTAHFKAIANLESTSGKYFKLTEDLAFGERTSTIIENFSGTFDGGNHTITYSGSFTANTEGQTIGLFGTNSGTITNLNIDANITVGGNAIKVKSGLLCGANTGTIEFCDVTGNVNSTVNSTSTGNGSTGLIVGSNLGDLQYCTGHGNVTGAGYVGGLAGSMGTIADHCDESANIKGCYFTGNVTANNSDSDLGKLAENIGVPIKSFGGGICGYVDSPGNIEFCVAEAIIVVGQNAAGITSTANSPIFAQVQYCSASNNYCTGTIIQNGVSSEVSDNNIVNIIYDLISWGRPDYGDDNYCEDAAATVVQNLNQAKNDDNFYFEVINGKVVLIVVSPYEDEEVICEAPTGFTVTINENKTFTASWSANGEGANTSFTESTFILTVTGGDLNETMEMPTIQNAFTITSDQALPESANPYVFTIKSQCAENMFSEPQQVILFVDPDCSPSVNLSNVTTTGATITWQGSVSTVTLGNNTYQITAGQSSYTFSNLNPETTYTAQVIFNCTREGQSYTKTLPVEFTTLEPIFITKQDGNFNDPNTWRGNVVPQGNIARITIDSTHKVIVNYDLEITNDYKIVENKGILQITQNGQLINNSIVNENENANVPGIVEIVSPQKSMNSWTFIGAPFENNYKLGTIYPMSHDISVSRYDYDSTKWDYEWAHVGTQIEAGEGYFAWPFYGGAVIFTTFGDVWNYTEGKVGEYVFNGQTETNLNYKDVEITKTIKPSPNNGGNWMALANPYPAKLSVEAFVDANDPVDDNTEIIQGRCVYVFRNGTFDMNVGQNGTQGLSSGNIDMTEGFFVNFKSAGSKTVIFTKEQLSYNQPSAKASANEFIELTLQNGDKKVRAYLAHNENAEQGYDIFDANKLFAPTEIAEPYFVTDGIELMKEEFAELPYYATMNVRSFANDTVSFVVNNIPEGLAVSIIDGENVIDMVEGGVYTTEILTGENADRFKVLIKKSVSISDVEELEVNITNNNRHISIATTETDLQVEVYNALGQKVLSTKDRNFTLNQVSAGAYLIKAFNNKASKTQKIVVE